MIKEDEEFRSRALNRCRTKFPKEYTEDGRRLGIRCSLVAQGKADLKDLEAEYEAIKEADIGAVPFFVNKGHINKRVYKTNRKWNGFIRDYFLNDDNEKKKMIKMSTITRRRLPYMAEDALTTELIENIRSNAFPNTTKILADKLRVVLAALDLGLPVSKACTLAGITKSTYNMWMDQAIAGQAPYTDILELFTIAQHNFEQKLLNTIEKSGTVGHEIVEKVEGEDAFGRKYTSTKTKTTVPSWQAASWLLEKLYRNTYAEDGVGNELEEIENQKKLEDDINNMDELSSPSQ